MVKFASISVLAVLQVVQFQPLNLHVQAWSPLALTPHTGTRSRIPHNRYKSPLFATTRGNVYNYPESDSYGTSTTTMARQDGYRYNEYRDDYYGRPDYAQEYEYDYVRGYDTQQPPLAPPLVGPVGLAEPVGEYPYQYQYQDDRYYSDYRYEHDNEPSYPYDPLASRADYDEYEYEHDYHNDRPSFPPQDDYYKYKYYEDPVPTTTTQRTTISQTTTTISNPLYLYDTLSNNNAVSETLLASSTMGSLNNMMDRMLLASTSSSNYNRLLAPSLLKDKVFRTLQLQDPQLDMDRIYDEAEFFLEQDVTCAELLGLPLRLDHPFSQSSATTSVNGETQSRTELQFHVDGRWNGGMVHLVATHQGILNMVLLVDGGDDRGYSRINVNLQQQRRRQGSNNPASLPLVDEDEIMDAVILPTQETRLLRGEPKQQSADGIPLLPQLPPRVPPAMAERPPEMVLEREPAVRENSGNTNAIG